MIEGSKSIRQMVIAGMVSLLVISLFWYAYLYFSGLEKSAIKAEFSQKSNVRMAVIAEELRESVMELGDSVASHKLYDSDMTMMQIQNMLGSAYEISSAVQNIFLLHYEKDPSPEVDLESSGEGWALKSLDYFYEQNLIPEKSHVKPKSIANGFAAPDFLKQLSLASKTGQPQFYTQYLSPPVFGNQSPVFQVIIPYRQTNQSDSGLGNRFVVMDLDFAKLVLNALDKFIKEPGGLDFYIFDGYVHPNRLIIYHPSRMRDAIDFESPVEHIPDISSLKTLSAGEFFLADASNYGQN